MGRTLPPVPEKIQHFLRIFFSGFLDKDEPSTWTLDQELVINLFFQKQLRKKIRFLTVLYNGMHKDQTFDETLDLTEVNVVRSNKNSYSSSFIELEETR